MAGDYSRWSDQPRKRFAEVLMQQGRVLLDADWNEQADILTRRDRTQALDTFGPCAIPRATTPEGFLIGVQTSPQPDLTIGVGRAYVDGRVVEAFPGDASTYLNQPFLPDPPPLSGMSGTGLVYLDVWDREVTPIEDPDLLDPALGGVDTTTRVQTVWQVRIVTGRTDDGPLSCRTDLGALFPPSAGRLTTEAVQPPASADPCILPESGGYRGVENQLYRVEIHVGGAFGAARFKWSRDASIVSRVEQIATAAATTLTVSRLGRDPILRFAVDDWVEILDDARELRGEAGLMARVTEVNEAQRTLLLDRALPAGGFDPSDASRHTRVRRWDQRRDVDADGLVAVAAGPIAVEHGVQVRFTADPAGGLFHAGDSWSFHARTADASVEILTQAPPRAITHHYCALATVTGLGTASPAVQDCRTLWPPDVAGGDHGCDCSVCVTAESHNSGALTIQHALDQVRVTGGTVCLASGLYQLGQTPLTLNGAGSVRLRGHGWRTMLLYGGDGPAIAVDGCLGVVLEELTVLTPPPIVLGDRRIGGGAAIALRNDFGVTIQRCQLLQLGTRESGSAAITMTGYLLDARVRENVIVAVSGVAGPVPGPEGRPGALLTADVAVEDNLFLCPRRGVSFGRESLHMADTRIARNLVDGCAQGGISAVGAVLGASRLDVEGNELRVRGDGIVVGTDGARIRGNDVAALPGATAGDGIALTDGLDPTGLDRAQLIGNRVVGVPGHGIAVRGQVKSAMIKQNVVQSVGGSGIFMETSSSAETLAVENNQILAAGMAASDGGRGRDFAGIRAVLARRADLSGNVVAGLAPEATLARSRVAIQAIGCASLRVAGNEVVDVGPRGEFAGDAAGVDVVVPASRTDVVDNAVRRSQTPPGDADRASWFGIRVRAVEGDAVTVAADVTLAPGRAGLFAFLGTRLRLLAAATETVGVRGNFVEAYGGTPAVDVAVRGAVVFGDNRVLEVLRQRQPAAVVRASRVTAASNYIAGPNDNDALILIVGPRAFTALGNNTPQKNIRVGTDPANVAALGPPWDALNVK
jgi:hypothetical protein